MEMNPMMSRRGIPVAFILIAAGVTPVGGQIIRPMDDPGTYDSPTVAVTGAAEEYAVPDRAVIHFEIVSRDATAEAAVMSNGATRSAILTQLTELGVADVGLWGVGSGIAGSEYGPPRGGAGSSFEARSGLRVVVSALERLDPVIATALLAGASVSRVELEVPQRAEIEARVFAHAVRRARASAEAMAEASGGRLGSLLNMRTMDASVPAAWTVYNGRPEGDWVTLDRSQTTVRAVVQVTWEYQPGGP